MSGANRDRRPTTQTWQIASALPRWRLWFVVLVFGVLGVLFMAARLDDELKNSPRGEGEVRP